MVWWSKSAKVFHLYLLETLKVSMNLSNFKMMKLMNFSLIFLASLKQHGLFLNDMENKFRMWNLIFYTFINTFIHL